MQGDIVTKLNLMLHSFRKLQCFVKKDVTSST